MFKFIGRWFVNILISIDQLGNSLLMGDPDETISARLGRIKEKFGGTIPMTRPVSKFTAWWLDKVQKNHVENAHQHEETKNKECGEEGLVDK